MFLILKVDFDLQSVCDLQSGFYVVCFLLSLGFQWAVSSVGPTGFLLFRADSKERTIFNILSFFWLIKNHFEDLKQLFQGSKIPWRLKKKCFAGS